MNACKKAMIAEYTMDQYNDEEGKDKAGKGDSASTNGNDEQQRSSS